VDAPSTAPAPADVDLERRDVRPDRRQVGLVLHVDSLGTHRAATGGTRRGRQHLHDRVDVRGHGPPRPRPVGAAGFATGPSRGRRRRAFGERRRLPLGSAPGGLQLVAQPVPLALEPIPLVAQLIALPLDVRLLALQPLDLAGLLPNAPRDLLARRVRQPPPCRHGRIQAWDAKKIQRPGASLHAEGANQRHPIYVQKQKQIPLPDRALIRSKRSC